jgi:formate dehydrogenase subunit gamma
MTTLIRACGLALVFFLAAGSGPALAQGSSSNAQAQQERAETQPLNNAPVWREVRSGNQGYSSLPGREMGVLVQSAGETWRQIRNGPVTIYGGWLLVIAVLALAAIYFALGPVKLHEKPTGRLVERFSTVERWAHWSTAITFVAPLFAVSVLALILVFVRDNIPKAGDLAWILGIPKFFLGKHLPSGRFNGGEKGWFWIGVVALSLTLVVSGAILLFPNFDQLRSTMQTASVVHWICALLLIAMSLGHIYVGTIGVEGAYQSMREGRVDETWAKEHHQLWYEEVKRGGKKAAPGGAMPAGATQMREKT